MCGIIGLIGEVEAGGERGETPPSVGDVVHQGLANLEYRGYDSAGVALVGTADGLTVAKQSGQVDELAVPE